MTPPLLEPAGARGGRSPARELKMSAKSNYVFDVIGFLAVAVIVLQLLAFFGRVRPEPGPNCIGNLMQIDGAKQEWALENKKTTNDAPTLNLLITGGYVRGVVRCPEGGVYTVGRVGELPSCSITQHNIEFRKWPRAPLRN